MPTPVGHILAGAILNNGRPRTTKSSYLLFAGVLFYSLLPDIDFLFGIPFNDVNRFHHAFTHSFVFVLVAAFLGGWIYAKIKGESVLISSAIFVSAGISHVILDILALDKRAPFGCPLFWPFSDEYIISPVLLFSDVSRASESELFFKSLLNWHNAGTVAIEIVVLAPLLWVIMWSRKQP